MLYTNLLVVFLKNHSFQKIHNISKNLRQLQVMNEEILAEISKNIHLKNE